MKLRRRKAVRDLNPGVGASAVRPTRANPGHQRLALVLAQRQQASLWALTEEALAELRAQRRIWGGRGRVSLPCRHPSEHQRQGWMRPA